MFLQKIPKTQLMATGMPMLCERSSSLGPPTWPCRHCQICGKFPPLRIRTVVNRDLLPENAAAPTYFGCHYHMHAPIGKKIVMLRDNMGPDQNLENHRNRPTGCGEIGRNFYAAGFRGLWRHTVLNQNDRPGEAGLWMVCSQDNYLYVCQRPAFYLL